MMEVSFIYLLVKLGCTIMSFEQQSYERFVDFDHLSEVLLFVG